jgi:hypothetical protein
MNESTSLRYAAVGTWSHRAALHDPCHRRIAATVRRLRAQESVSDAKVRRYFAIPSSDSLTERRILNALDNQLPQGTPRSEILNYLEQRGVGRDSMTQLLYSDTSSQIVLRIGEAPINFVAQPRSCRSDLKMIG